MGWEVGYDHQWQRDIGYGVPALCDHPACQESINRGLSYVCGQDVYGGEHGCGLFFCGDHLLWARKQKTFVCERCHAGLDPFEPTPDSEEWVHWKLTDESWKEWREAHPEVVQQMKQKAST